MKELVPDCFVILDSSKDLSGWIARSFDSKSSPIVDDDSEVGNCGLGIDFSFTPPLSSVKMIVIINMETKRIENIDVSFGI